MSSLRKRNGQWQARIQVKGQPERSKTFRTKAQAERWLKLAEFDDTTTVRDLLDRYSAEVTAHKKGRNQENARIIALQNEFGDKRVSWLTADDLAEWSRRRLKHVQSDTVRRDLAVLSGAIETGNALGWIECKNPARAVLRTLSAARTLKKPVKRVRRISDDELTRLLRELRPTMQRIVRFALETAMRRGEIANMKWEHVSDAGLFIPADKTDTQSTIPLSSRARAVLAEIDGSTGKVFNLRPDSITQAFDRACKRADIDGLRFHDLRREATSRFFEMGLSIPEVQMITRHADLRSLQIYTKLSIDHVTSRLG